MHGKISGSAARTQTTSTIIATVVAGITLCERWQDSSLFIEDMLPTWEPGLTIERKDVSGNYEPSNCEWTTQQRQVRNKESTIKVEIDGTLVPITDLADRYGINRHTLWQRWRNGKRGADLIAPVR